MNSLSHWSSRPLSLRKLVVEWGGMGLPVWEFGRRNKIRERTSQALKRLQEKFDMPLTPTVYAALTCAEEQGHDLRAILVRDFGHPPKRPKRREPVPAPQS